MSTLLCNIFTSESNLFHRKLMLSCAIINLIGFFDLMCSMFNKDLNLTCVLTLKKYSELVKMTLNFQNQCHLKQ